MGEAGRRELSGDPPLWGLVWRRSDGLHELVALVVPDWREWSRHHDWRGKHKLNGQSRTVVDRSRGMARDHWLLRQLEQEQSLSLGARPTDALQLLWCQCPLTGGA
jgi:hypothetical protein